MDFYNPILSYNFLQTEINPLQPSKMETAKPQNSSGYFYTSYSFCSPVGPLLSINYMYLKTKLNNNNNKKSIQMHSGQKYLQNSWPNSCWIHTKISIISSRSPCSFKRILNTFIEVHRVNCLPNVIIQALFGANFLFGSTDSRCWWVLVEPFRLSISDVILEESQDGESSVSVMGKAVKGSFI